MSSGISGASTSSGSRSGCRVSARNITPIVTGESGRSVDDDLVPGVAPPPAPAPAGTPRVRLRGEPLDPDAAAPSGPERRARDPRLGHLQHRGADPPPLADDRTGHVQADGGEVLAEQPAAQRPAQLAPPRRRGPPGRTRTRPGRGRRGGGVSQIASPARPLAPQPGTATADRPGTGLLVDAAAPGLGPVRLAAVRR